MISDIDIIEHCGRAGLAIAGVSWRDELLLLEPTSLDGLPAADELASLGEELKTKTGARWVALNVDALAEAT